MTQLLSGALRPSIRTRLALVYGGVFFCMGVGLIAVSYAIVDHSLSPAGTGGTVARFVTIPGGPLAGLPGALSAPRMISPDGQPIDVPAQGVAVTVRGSTQLKTGLEQLITDVRLQTLHSLLLTWAAVIAVLAVAAGILGWLLAARMLKPLRDITATARRLSVENLHERIEFDGPRDELKELADTFDGMLCRLEAAFGSQRRFVANASHELRTPLAIMRAQVDVALDDSQVTRAELLATSRVVRDAVVRCERLLDGLLVLARSDRGLDATERVELSESVTRAIEQISPRARQRGIELRTALTPAAVDGDQSLLDRLVANLLENAVEYNQSAGWVEVSTSNGGDRARLRVTNTGPPIPAEQVPSLFEPFRRLTRDRTASGRGAGLGLSIVRSVARAHGGDARARAQRAGGLTVEVLLPASGPQAT